MEFDKTKRPTVGTGIMIFKYGKILLGRRKGTRGSGEYSFPGGHLEFREVITESALREVKEECGLEVHNIRFLFASNIKQYDKHYVNINFAADWKSGEPQNLEPEKCEGWDWYAMDNLPSPLFATTLLSIESFKTGKHFFDA
jgi:8-oxo-dGTP diphosphatase